MRSVGVRNAEGHSTQVMKYMRHLQWFLKPRPVIQQSIRNHVGEHIGSLIAADSDLEELVLPRVEKIPRAGDDVENVILLDF